MPELLVREDIIDGAVAVLTLNRPASRNSLSRAMLAALREALAEIGGDEGIRCVVVAAEGPVFSAGHDLKELAPRRADPDGGEAFFAETMAECAAMMQQVVHLPQPVVAAVEGLATAAGLQLAASCDLVVAAEGARFCTPGVDIGLFCSTPAVALARAVPRKAAMEMLLLGEMVPAAEAHRIGLVQEVVPAGQQLARATEIAQLIAKQAPLGVYGTLANARVACRDEAAAREHLADLLPPLLVSEDAAEGVLSFVERREARFTGR